MLRDPESSGASGPRVIILGTGPEVAIDVVDLEVAPEVGSVFCHRGAHWRVTGRRPRTRVLHAEPVEGAGRSAVE